MGRMFDDFEIIAVDFDGTLCSNEWPWIGEGNERLISKLIEERTNGNKVILWTCRSGEELVEAIAWCNARGLYFDAVNSNVDVVLDEFGGDDSRKIYADRYIDDKNCSEFSLPFEDDEDLYFELKHCPFCKKEASLGYKMGRAYVGCMNEDCLVQPSTLLKVKPQTIRELIRAWNKRGK